MTLFEVVEAFKVISLAQKNIRTFSCGSIYEYYNANPNIQYNGIHLSQTSHRIEDDWAYFGFNIFFIGRLLDNLETNRLELQSEGTEVLQNIIRIFCDHYNIEMPTIVIQPFTQRFSDECAGVYATLELEIPLDWLCEDGDYVIGDITTTGDTKLQYKNIRITSNGTTTVGPDMGYDGLYGVTITTQVPQTGYTEQDLDDAYRDGENHQKSKLTALTATTNGTYTRADGYSAVTVEVEQSGQTFETQTLTATANGTYTPSSGYDGFNQVIVNVPIPGTATTNDSVILYTTQDGNPYFINADLPKAYDPYGNELQVISNTYENGQGRMEFNGVLYSFEAIFMDHSESNKLLTVILPEGLASLQNSCFGHNYTLREVTLPKSLYYIGPHSFYSCNIFDININYPVSTIAYQAFRECRNLSAITFTLGNIWEPMTIQTEAFYNCYSLKDIYFYPASSISGVRPPYPYNPGQYTLPYLVGENIFSNVQTTGTIHLPKNRDRVYNVSEFRSALPSGWVVRYDL